MLEFILPVPMPSGAAAEASAAAAPAGDSGNGRAATPQMTPPSDTPPSAPPAERHGDSERKKTSDGRNALSSDDDDESGSDASIDAFSLETVLSDARRDVTAVTGWGPDAALVALDGGCLLVLRRDRRGGGKGKASAAPSISTPSARRSVPTTTAVGSASTSSASALADAAYPWRLAAAHSHLASKRIAQLEVVSSGGSSSSSSSGGGGGGGGGGGSRSGSQLLLALTEEGVTAFRLPGLAMTAQAGRTAGSSRFAWQPGPRLLAVVAGGGGGGGARRAVGGAGGGGAGSKKVSVFRHDGKEFVLLRELSAPVQPLAVAWAGPCVLVSGSSGSWWALRLSSGGSSSAEAPPPASSSSPLPASEEIFPPPPSGRDGGGASSSSSFLPLACPFSSPSAPAAAAVSLGRRGAALVAADGRPARGGRAPALWRGAGAPAALAGAPPWLLAALPGGVEARPLDPALSPDLLCQTLPLACMAVAGASSSPGGDVFFAGGGRVARLRPRALVAVAAAACAAGRHADAVALAALAPESDPRRGPALDSARRALAGSVFAAGDFEGALALLGMVGRSGGSAAAAAAAAASAAAASSSPSSRRPASPPPAFGPRDAAAPLALLRLFPSLAPADLLEAAEASCCCCEDGGGGDEEEVGAEEEEGEEEEEAEGGEEGEAGLRRKPTSSSSWPALKLPAEPTGEAYEKAVAALLPYLLSFRGRLMAAVGGGGKSDEEVARDETATTPSASSPSTLSPAALDSLATLVDTAVLLAMIAAPDDSGAALRFVSSSASSSSSSAGSSAPPRCRLSDVAPKLSAKGRYAELVALLRGAGRHEAALDLLRRISTDPESLEGARPAGAAADLAGAVTGAWAAARYLLRPAPSEAPPSPPRSSSSSAAAAAAARPPPPSSRSLGGSRPDLVHEHGRWIVAADADAGLDLLLGLEPPPPPEAALAVLRSRGAASCSSSSSAKEAAPGPEAAAASPGLAATYLTAAVERGIAPAARWEGELAGLCLRAALEEEAALPAAAAAAAATKGKEEENSSSLPLPPPPVGPARGAEIPYARLLSLIDSSPHVDPGRLLALLPAGALLAARARLLSRLGRVGEALRVAAAELRDDELAEAIAARVCEERQRRGGGGAARAPAALGGRGENSSGGGGAGVASASDPAPATVEPYLELIRLFLQRDENGEGEEGKGGSRKGWAAAARLLATAAPPSSSALDSSSSSSSFLSSSSSSRRFCRPVLDPAAAIDLLPEDASLLRARPLVAAALSGAREARARASIERGLSRAAALGARAAAAAARRRGVRLTGERGCAACGKGFAAGTAFALLPGGGGGGGGGGRGAVMHYGCFRARERAAGRRGATATDGE